MLISVIIPAHNEEKYIEKTLKSLNKQTLNRGSYEIIVCNDASSDDTCGLSEKYADKVLNLAKQKSISKVRNNGAKIAKGRILVFVDADTIVKPNLLKVISKTINKKTAFCAPIQMYNNKSMRAFLEFNKFLLQNMPELGLIGGCCMAISKDAFNELNGFDENYLMNEDRKMHLELLKRGYKFKIINTSVRTSDRKIKKLGLVKFMTNSIHSFLMPKKADYIKIR
ncbi:Glycosyltransferase AglE [Candidatus Tiddalikarchaeum anstoanum]|nr:Glycosyltransferase AglE [Candidatus Tiddalikarchaeum anstoanum]